MYLLVVYMSIHIRTFSEPRHCYLPPEVVSVLGERDPGCLGFMVLTSGFCPEDMKCSLHLDIHCNLCVKGFQGSYFDICCTSSMHVYVRVNIYIYTYMQRPATIPVQIPEPLAECQIVSCSWPGRNLVPNGWEWARFPWGWTCIYLGGSHPFTLW